LLFFFAGLVKSSRLDFIRGKRDQLVGKIQEGYGIAKDAAEHQVDEFIRTYETTPSGTREEEKKRGAGR
jgi:hypothetical protein